MRYTKMAQLYEHLVPPGASVKTIRDVLWSGITVSGLYSLTFLIRYIDKRESLFYTDSVGRKHLTEGALMPDFADIIGDSLGLFWILAVALLGFIIYHYMYYRRGSKSIYLMRRLPSAWEIHKRSITMPVLVSVCTVICAFIMLMIYFAIYMLATPDKCIVSGQWLRLWEGLL